MNDHHLTTEQTQLVLRRAAEIEDQRAAASRGGEALTTEDVDAIAAEVGLSPDAVRHALSELRAGVLGHEKARRTLADRAIGPAVVVLEREVPGRPEEVAARIHEALRDQLLEVIRDLGDRQEWRRADSLLAKMRRALDIRRRYMFPKGCEITSQVEAAEGAADRSLARFVIRMDVPRTDRLVGAAAGAIAGAAIALTGILATAGHPPVEILSILGGGSLASGVFLRARRTYQRELGGAQNALELLLDRLEHRRLPP